MAKQLYGRDLVDKVADFLGRFQYDYPEWDMENEARELLDLLTPTFGAVRLKGYQKGYEDALTEPPF